MKNTSYDVVVIGAGITGSYIAYLLARSSISTLLVDVAGVASKASGNNPGGLNPFHGPGIPGPMEALATRSFSLHLENLPEINELSNAAASLERVTRLDLAVTDDDRRTLSTYINLYGACEGFSAEWVDPVQLRSLEPRIGEGALGALFSEGNALVDGRIYTEAVFDAALTLGAEFAAGRFIGVDHSGNRAHAIKLEAEKIRCGAVVIATGAEVDVASAVFDVDIPVRPVKGQLLLAEPARRFSHHVCWRQYGIYRLAHDRARRFEAVWLGGTREEDAGFDLAPTRASRGEILATLTGLVPEIGRTRIRRHIAASRPVTPDGMPVVGAIGGWDNAYLASGAGVKGMLLSSGIAESIANQLAGVPQAISMDGCHPDRFSDPVVELSTGLVARGRESS